MNVKYLVIPTHFDPLRIAKLKFRKNEDDPLWTCVITDEALTDVSAYLEELIKDEQ